MNTNNAARAWKTIWSAGQGFASIRHILPAADLCRRLPADYRIAIRQMRADPFALRLASHLAIQEPRHG